ncbi:MAG: hypothetical protein NTZ18_01950 [Candidatus Komeilibacteria bacterium]|nr:hypothetical protein [Candidatus Komeilibacteria bacterium]
MGKQIVLLLLALVILFVFMQNHANVWLYIIVLVATLGFWNLLED